MSAGKGAVSSSTYSREEMDAILQRALQRQSIKREGVSHDELVAAAEEIGLPREEIEAAARDLAEEKARDAIEKEKLAPLEDQRARMKMRLARGWAIWLGMGAMFFGIAQQTHAHGFFIPLAAVGIMLLIRTMKAFYGPLPQKKESKRERRERRREEKLRELERKVAIGTDAVVRVVEAARGRSAATGSAARAAAPSPSPAAEVAPLVTAFDAFAKRGGTPSVAETSESPAARNRVETPGARSRVPDGRDDDLSDEIEDEIDEPARKARR